MQVGLAAEFVAVQPGFDEPGATLDFLGPGVSGRNADQLLGERY